MGFWMHAIGPALADARETLLVARDAVLDLVEAALLRFVGQLGIRHMSAQHSDHIRLALRKHLLTDQWVDDAADYQNRHRRDRRTDGAGKRRQVGLGLVEGGQRPGT